MASKPGTGGEASSIRATVDHVIYHAQDTGYAVLACSLADGTRARVTGTFPAPYEGMAFEAAGEWRRHASYGLQFFCETWTECLPSSTEAMKKYLADGPVRGIGPVLAERLVAAFGERTFDVIDNEPQCLYAVPGIGKKKVEAILERWKEQRAIRHIMVFLKEHNVSNTMAAKIYNQYGDKSIEVLQETPYRLAYDIFGVGFTTADRIAMLSGVDDHDPERLKCGLLYVLDEARKKQGHMYLPHRTLMHQAAAAFSGTVPPPHLLEDALEDLEREGRVTRPDGGEGEDAVYAAAGYRTERSAAERLAALAACHGDGGAPFMIPATGTEYSPQQQRAIRVATTAGVSIITGGPGTGKTTTIKGILAAFHAQGKDVLLASPTGKAAKRLEEATGEKASTIHRLLEWSPSRGGFQRNEDNPLEGDAIIVDETSMVDTPLLDSLLRAVPDGMHTVFVGDADQLPSVGPGSSLLQMMNAGFIATVRLNTVFRQALDSDIIRGAHAINGGRVPDFSRRQDLWLSPCNDAKATADAIMAYIKRSLENGRTMDDVQVLSPKKDGDCGIEELNRRIQALVNPDGRAVVTGYRELRVGDRVINLRNNYDAGIFNGDQGTVTGDDEEEGTFDVDFDGRRVTFKKCDADQLLHAWAMTVHRSQGSEFRTVIIAATRQHAGMLTRQLLYTAVTRAKSLCLVFGQEEALSAAVKNSYTKHRCTRLARYIAEAAAAEASGTEEAFLESFNT